MNSDGKYVFVYMTCGCELLVIYNGKSTVANYHASKSHVKDSQSFCEHM